MVGTVSDFVLGSYVLSSKPNTKSDPTLQISKVMGISECPWLDDILIVLIDRLNDSLPAESKLPSLLE